jgi:hypothetical protein
MKIRVIVVFLFVFFFFSGCSLLGIVDKPYNNPQVNLLSTSMDINEPEWFDNNTLLATTGFNNKILKLNLKGKTIEEYTVDLENLVRMNLITITPDKSLVAMNVEHGLENSKVQDIFLFDLADKILTPVTSGGGFHGPSFIDNDNLIFFEYDRSVPEQDTMRILKYTLSTENTTTIYTGVLTKDNSGAYTDDNYWWPKVNPATGDILLCGWSVEASANTYFIIDSDGNVINDLSDFVTFNSHVRAGDWIDANTIYVSAQNNTSPNHYIIDMQFKTITPVIEVVPAEVVNIYGANLSPDGSMAASHAWCEAGNYSGNKLLLVYLD